MSTELAVLDAAVVERAADPGEFVVLACERAKEWLAQALEQGDIESIVELKSQAEAIRVYTAQKQLGKHAELSAQEIVRRAERGLGIAVKRGQETGDIAPPSRSAGPVNAALKEHRGQDVVPVPKPMDFFANHAEREDAGSLASASEPDFEQALGEAKAEGNLSRANVVRKAVRNRIVNAEDEQPRNHDEQPRNHPAAVRVRQIRELAEQAHTSQQIADAIGVRPEYVRILARQHGIEIKADTVVGRTKRIDSNRIVNEAVAALEGVAFSLRLAEPEQLDRSQVVWWAESLGQSLRSLNQLVKQLKEMARDQG